ncbi:MAG: phosphoribosylanthranilate isomerase, partial [Chloroflexi bacterium]|nr:phosphoribosylanthranilate isomerase [Chloroflexota bacterium]
LNFYPKSPRYLPPEAARRLIDDLRGAVGPDHCPLLVGVFVNTGAAEITEIMQIAGLDAAQLSGDESADVVAALAGRVIKAIRPRSPEETISAAGVYLPYAAVDDRLPSLLVDAYHKELYGGTGEQAGLDVALAARQIAPRLMLAGGLTPENVAGRVRAVHPWGVDVASGVERDQPGRKDQERVQAFISAVREVNDGL